MQPIKFCEHSLFEEIKNRDGLCVMIAREDRHWGDTIYLYSGVTHWRKHLGKLILNDMIFANLEIKFDIHADYITHRFLETLSEDLILDIEIISRERHEKLVKASVEYQSVLVSKSHQDLQNKLHTLRFGHHKECHEMKIKLAELRLEEMKKRGIPIFLFDYDVRLGKPPSYTVDEFCEMIDRWAESNLEPLRRYQGML